MIDTTDLTSYYPGYEDYCKSKETIKEEYDNSDKEYDSYRDEMLIRKEQEKMQREIIDLTKANMTFDKIMELKDYIWENDKLIPSEMLEGK